jgi:thiol-disulfide isomerase/thioredoxin
MRSRSPNAVSRLALVVAMAQSLVCAPARSEDARAVIAAPTALSDRAMLARLTQGHMRKFEFLELPRPLPELQIESADDVPSPLSAWRGRLLLLNVWASWCAPCRQEMPALDRLATRMSADRVAVVTLSIDKRPAEAKAFLAQLGLERLPLLLDPDMHAARALGVDGAPTSILIDPAGRELGRVAGAVDWDADEALLLVRAMALRVRETTPAANER